MTGEMTGKLVLTVTVYNGTLEDAARAFTEMNSTLDVPGGKVEVLAADVSPAPPAVAERIWMLADDIGIAKVVWRDRLTADERAAADLLVDAFLRLGSQFRRKGATGTDAPVGDELVRTILEAICVRDGLPLDSAVEPGQPARNYELTVRLGIGHVFGIMATSPTPPETVQPVTDAGVTCWYLAGCRWPRGCDAEARCMGQEVE